MELVPGLLNKPQRNGLLDLLRAAAIVLVVNCHIASTLLRSSPESGSVFQFSILKALTVGGHGVDLFFVLSGWLLGTILLRELKATGTIQLKRFFARRWLRTLPAYYVVLALTFLQRAIQGNMICADSSYLLFLQTYAYPSMPFFGISWSLCVEEHFYLLIAPALLFFAPRGNAIWAMFLMLLIAPMFFRLVGFYGNLEQSHVRLDQCAVGVLLAYMYEFYKSTWNQFQIASQLLALLATVVFSALMISRGIGLGIECPLVGYSLIFAAWVALSSGERWQTFGQGFPIIGYIATRSYAIYLVHVEGISLSGRLGIESSIGFAAITWIASLTLAELLHRFVELPGMALRNHDSWNSTNSTGRLAP